MTIPPNPYFAINLEIAKVNLPNLPADFREDLARRVYDPPPRKTYALVGDALRELSQGHTSEGWINKLVRVLLWCLLHFPGQFVPTHTFLSWATGIRVLKASYDVKKYMKAKPKIHKAVIKMVGYRVVAYCTQKQTPTDPSTVDGFRLTTDGDDYYREINARNDRRLSNAMERAANDVDDSRILTSDIQNAGYRAQVKKDKEILKDLKKRGVLGHFAKVPHLLAEGTKSPRSDGR